MSLEKIVQLTGSTWLPTTPVSQITNEQLERVRVVAAAKDAVRELLTKRQVRSLEEQVIREELGEGSLFTCHRDFYGKGLQGLSYSDPSVANAEMAEVYSNLSGIDPYKKLRVHYHPSNIYSVSGWSALGGHQRLFVVGYVDRKLQTVIHARPLVIGQVISEDEDADIGWILDRYGRLYPEAIDELGRMQEVRRGPTRDQLNILRRFPEQEIKTIFADLVGEPFVSKDWGGERSDLYTSNVHINRRRLSAAFILKGPAQFKRMTVASLGKNGDQIYRAFSEPAELVVLQHCHEIDSSVIATMRAFATRAGEQRLFCVIDGGDTWRLLKAHGYLN